MPNRVLADHKKKCSNFDIFTKLFFSSWKPEREL